MSLDRRGFLRTLGVTAAAAVLDPEKLLWVPGAKTFFLPSPTYDYVTDSVSGISLRYIQQWDIEVDWIQQKVISAIVPIETAFPIDTVAGRYAVNPITRQTTDHLQKFLVTSVSASGVDAPLK